MTNVFARRLQNFVRMSEDDMTILDRFTQTGVRRVQPRRDLISEGDKPRSMFIILEGWACRYKQLPDGRRQVVAFFLPGNLCDLNMFILRQADHSMGAITPMRVAELDRDDFDRLFTSNPRITQALFWDELVTMATQREWTLNLGQRSAYERIAHLLVESFYRLRSVGLTDGNSCDFPLTQSDIADATGLTSVHVNRMLQELRGNGLIELQSRRLTIPDLRALESAAMFNDNYLHLGREGAHLDANA